MPYKVLNETLFIITLCMRKYAISCYDSETSFKDILIKGTFSKCILAPMLSLLRGIILFIFMCVRNLEGALEIIKTTIKVVSSSLIFVSCNRTSKDTRYNPSFLFDVNIWRDVPDIALSYCWINKMYMLDSIEMLVV